METVCNPPGSSPGGVSRMGGGGGGGLRQVRRNCFDFQRWRVVSRAATMLFLFFDECLCEGRVSHATFHAWTRWVQMRTKLGKRPSSPDEQLTPRQASPPNATRSP